MAKFQLWSRDEYGQGSILFTSEDVNEVIKRGKQEVTSLNVGNALTSTDRENNWEAYFVDVKTSAKSSKVTYVYGSQDVHTKDRVYAVTDKDVKSIVVGDVPKPVVNVYLGNISVKRNEEIDWVASDLRVRPIADLTHPDLADKTIFFIKKV
jgi:hypothetical protein